MWGFLCESYRQVFLTILEVGRTDIRRAPCEPPVNAYVIGMTPPPDIPTRCPPRRRVRQTGFGRGTSRRGSEGWDHRVGRCDVRDHAIGKHL
jgi:hypothetical protein